MKAIPKVSLTMLVTVAAGMLVGCAPNHTVHVRSLKSGDIAAVKRLFVSKSDVEMQLQIGSHRRFWSRPLHLAVSSGKLETVEYLLQLGASPNDKDYRGESAFFYISTDRAERDMIKLLKDAGGDINQPDTDYALTPLMTAAMSNSPRFAAALIAEGADLHAKDRLGRTALDLARQEDSEEIISLIEAASMDN